MVPEYEITKDERSTLLTSTFGDGKRFIVRADEKVRAFFELEINWSQRD